MSQLTMSEQEAAEHNKEIAYRSGTSASTMTTPNENVLNQENALNPANERIHHDSDPRQQPNTMRAALITRFGPIADVLKVVDNARRPVIARGDKGHMLIKVMACSPNTADTHTIDGSLKYIRTPELWPYIPGHDVCGIVTELPPSETRFRLGDVVISTMSDAFLMGGLAEYMLVDMKMSALKPMNVSNTDAACVGTSLLRAMEYARLNVKKGDRVLVLGGSGGIGTFLLQILKRYGASFVATTSTQEQLCMSLGADRVIDYKTTNWWVIPQFLTEKFDIIFDCCPSKTTDDRCNWSKAKRSVVKSGLKGGRFVAIAQDNPERGVKGALDAFALGYVQVMRPIKTAIWKRWPKWSHGTFTNDRDTLDEAVKLLSDKAVKVVMHVGSPFSFTTQGVKAALDAVASKHAHGKVVVDISNRE